MFFRRPSPILLSGVSREVAENFSSPYSSSLIASGEGDLS